jgi:hypothetical protein
LHGRSEQQLRPAKKKCSLLLPPVNEVKEIEV